MTKRQKKIIFILFTAVIMLGGLLWLQDIALAQTPDLGLQPVGENIGLPATDIRLVVARIIRTALGLLGIVAVVLVIYGGVVWMTAGGNEEKIAQAKKILVNAVIGLVIILSSYAIASFVISKLVGATTGVPEHCANGQFDAGVETQTDCGGECPACFEAENPYFPGGIFYVDSLPQGGQICIRNVHLAITFNRPVDTSTLAENISITKSAAGAEAGEWRTVNGNTAEFVPNGDCGSGPSDCFAANSQYTLHFVNGAGIKTSDGAMSLNCNVKAGCHDVVFTTGEGVDRLPPTITIEQIPADQQKVDSVIPVTLSWTDDNGVQKLDLNADGWFVGSTTTVGCQKTGSVQVSWPTNGLASGIHSLQGTAYDWSMQQGATTTNVNLKPAHCFDNVLDPPGEIQVGPPACGPDCGACGGGTCTNNSDCASGDCENGVCVDRVRINGVSPLNGAPGTLVSISGYYFGTTTGKVFINNTQMPVAACGVNIKNWTSNQIIVEVPQGATTGSIKVETAPAAGGRKFTDATNDDFGPRIDDFAVNAVIRPGVCGVVPNTDVPGADVVVSGKHFGSVPDKILFGQLNAAVVPNNWTDASIQTKVPFLEPGAVAIKVVRNNVESNGIIFYVTGGYSSTTPIISNITPASGTKGEYITITGNNFGDAKGRVWFKLNNNGQAGEAIDGDLDSFPAECKGIWSDKQIIVKFPQGSGTAGQSYYVQVLPAEAGAGWSPLGPTFNLKNGEPSPGICNITPVSGPVPFAAGAPKMKIAGQYFGTVPEVYFWAAGAAPDSVNGRILVAAADIVKTVSGKSEYLELNPPLGTQSGPVVVFRSTDSKMSNPVAFNVYDCVKNNNQCNIAGTKCCAVGGEKGMCKALCADETLSAGYIWRFCTKDIPQVPHVVERCDSGTDEGKNIPSPSPSVIWDVSAGEAHHNVCRTAEIVVEFSMAGINPISNGNLTVNQCDAATVDEKKHDCTPASPGSPVSLDTTRDANNNIDPQLSTSNNDYVELNPVDSYNGGRWLDNTWYQVVLKTGISAGSGTSTANLAKDAPCNAADSAYCFLFKTDARDCKMKAVVVTPYMYWTSVLEEPIKFRTNPGDEGEDVIYSGHGLSDQHCIWMDVSGFNWSWNSSNTDYAKIYAGSQIKNEAKVSAVANTVGVGLTNPDNAVNVNAVASTGSLSYTGHSPLTVDLSNPEVVDYWPNCIEACTDAEVGVKFNTSMSNKNLIPGAAAVNGTVQLLKCLDENCLDTEPALDPTDIIFDPNSNNTILKIANSRDGSAELASNTIYKIVLSASSADPLSATNQLWSAASLQDFNSYSKPYNRQFTWRFKTKKDKCLISRAEVKPVRFIASHTDDRRAYTVQPYSSPDKCSAAGQKLNPWKVNWNWASSDPDVAGLKTFSSQGISPYCTGNCVKKGSSIASGLSLMLPVCGNSVVEAGEDCDPPNKNTGCGLNCLRTGNTNTTTCGNTVVEPELGEKCDPADPRTPVGCTDKCLHAGSLKNTAAADINASICGNGAIGSGEDCDLGIDPNTTDPKSALGCSQSCVHQGTRLSSGWCKDNAAAYAGFSKNQFTSACASSFSQCGNGVPEPDEDAGCDLGGGQNAAGCTDLCLNKVDSICDTDIEIIEGCSIFRKLKGSSLLYSTPSLCGDGEAGIGEDPSCEQGLPNEHAGKIDPWALVLGVGRGQVSGDPPSQTTAISAQTTENTKGGPVGGRGWYEIRCGYASDNECRTNFDSSYALASNSCCYIKPNLLDVYPGTTTLVQQDICPNTAVEFEFDLPIDVASLPGNLLIAKGTSSTDNCTGTIEVTSLIARAQTDNGNLPWYHKVWLAVVNFVKNLFGGSAVAQGIEPTKWCAGADLGTPEVVSAISSTGTNRISIRLSAPLAVDTHYAIILKPGVRDKRGVSIGTAAADKNIYWRFVTAGKLCEATNATVKPAQVYLSKVGATSTLEAQVFASNGQKIQPIKDYYYWEHIWAPASNPYVTLQDTKNATNTISAQNRNGELDVRAGINITDNKYTNIFGAVATGKSHVIVYLCETPWPPKDLFLGNNGPFVIFPYEDKDGNNDGFSLADGMFDNTAIPPSTVGGYFNFSTYYCTDGGVSGTTTDDLPYLRPAVQISADIVAGTPTSSMKRFIFTNEKNADAIGIQIFANNLHLTVSDWFAAAKELGGQGFAGNMQGTMIDGYEAITDGNNIYVDSLNVSDTSNPLHNIYTNIYLFSINADAQPETRKIFDQMMQDLSFNTNLTNYGYCGTDFNNPGDTTACKTDFDCPGGEVCSVQKDKLQRNYQRLRDLNLLQTLIGQ